MKVFLDVGLTRTTTGARVFGAMKGASDGGLLVPHSENRFPGYDPEGKELDADTLRKYIFAGHVGEYMESLADDDEERYKLLFNGYIEDDLDAEGLEELYTEAHKAIREDPFKKESNPNKKSADHWTKESVKYRQKKLTHEEKRKKVQARVAELRK
jgi:large subunit ribosomal protein L5e